MNESQNLGNNRPAYRKATQGRRPQQRAQGRVRATAPQLHGRGYQTPGQRRRNANGYQLQRHPINFAGRRGRANATDPRLVVLLAVVLVALVLVVFNVVSCVSSLGTEETTVAPGVSSQLNQELTQAVNQADQLKAIAATADQYPDGLVQLALSEPDAIGYVYGYRSASKDAQAFDQSVTAGQVPVLYDWDTRWGYTDYAGQPFALTGSGPTALAMARMALLGQNDQDPATLAQLATQANQASGDSGTQAAFFTDKATDLGLTVETLDLTKPLGDSTGASETTDDATTADDQTTDDATDQDAEKDASGITGANSRLSVEDLASKLTRTLGDSTYLLVETSGGALGSTAHWVLVTQGDNGAVRVFDPTSTQNTQHQWDAATVASDVTQALSVSAATQQ